MKCENCKHWTRIPSTNYQVNFGTCAKLSAPEGHDYTEENLTGLSGTPLCSHDGPISEVETKEWFGCIHFAAAAEEAEKTEKTLGVVTMPGVEISRRCAEAIDMARRLDMEVALVNPKSADPGLKLEQLFVDEAAKLDNPGAAILELSFQAAEKARKRSRSLGGLEQLPLTKRPF